MKPFIEKENKKIQGKASPILEKQQSDMIELLESTPRVLSKKNDQVAKPFELIQLPTATVAS
jgi:hypothetical protein